VLNCVAREKTSVKICALLSPAAGPAFSTKSVIGFPAMMMVDDDCGVSWKFSSTCVAGGVVKVLNMCCRSSYREEKMHSSLDDGQGESISLHGRMTSEGPRCLKFCCGAGAQERGTLIARPPLAGLCDSRKLIKECVIS
jgi:hypothetical protein